MESMRLHEHCYHQLRHPKCQKLKEWTIFWTMLCWWLGLVVVNSWRNNGVEQVWVRVGFEWRWRWMYRGSELWIRGNGNGEFKEVGHGHGWERDNLEMGNWEIWDWELKLRNQQTRENFFFFKQTMRDKFME